MDANFKRKAVDDIMEKDVGSAKIVKHKDGDENESDDDSSQIYKNSKKEDQKEIISQKEWDSYTANMFPAKPLNGRLLEILKQLLESIFSFDPTTADENGNSECSDDEDDPYYEAIYDNFQKFCKMCAEEDPDNAGLAWLNALHQFEEPDNGKNTLGGKFTPLTYVIQKDPDDFRTVGMLLDYGADANLRDGMGEPPLFKVLERDGRWKTGHALMEAGANALAGFGGKTIVGWAKVWSKDFQGAKMLYDDFKRKYGIFEDHDGNSEGDY